MSFRNLPKFIQLRSISKSRFSGINTNSDITPPNNLDMVTFEFLLHEIFCLPKHNHINQFDLSNKGHSQVVAINLKQRRMYNLTMSSGSSFY
jgi:hypothetical protein